MRYWKFNRGGSSSYLMHHGIEGQRWGVRHGPPYPLDSKVSTGSRLKVKTKKLAAYNKSEQARIRSGAQLGAYVGGIPGAVIGQHLSKKHIEQEKAGVRNKNYTNEDYTSRNMNTSTYGLIGRALTTHKIKKENSKSEVNDTPKADVKNTYASEKMINKWSKETKGGNVISDAMEKALFDDDYDVDFLEKIQNESYFEGNDDSSVNKRLTEYKKYLTNKHSNEAKNLGYETPKKETTKKAASSKPNISDVKIKKAITDDMKDVTYDDGTPVINVNDLKRMSWDSETQQDTWSDGHGNYFTLELHNDPKTGKAVIDPKLITWDD